MNSAFARAAARHSPRAYRQLNRRGRSSHTNPIQEVEEKKSEGTGDVPSNGSDKIGTYVFGAFSAISVLVSIAKGIVPIYLVEAAVWAGCRLVLASQEDA